jgi:hypothetical protein
LDYFYATDEAAIVFGPFSVKSTSILFFKDFFLPFSLLSDYPLKKYLYMFFRFSFLGKTIARMAETANSDQAGAGKSLYL